MVWMLLRGTICAPVILQEHDMDAPSQSCMLFHLSTYLCHDSGSRFKNPQKVIEVERPSLAPQNTWSIAQE
jgi:hypothetical protein